VRPDQTMRLDSLAMVNRISEARGALLHQIAVIQVKRDAGSMLVPHLCVTIDGRHLPEDTIAVLRPVLIAELQAQVAKLDRDLVALGVTVG
jgi:uncharacterized protein YjhX (UPF0386 family)